MARSQRSTVSVGGRPARPQRDQRLSSYQAGPRAAHSLFRFIRIDRTESLFFVAACLSLVSCWLRWGKLNGSQPEFRSFTRSVCCRRSTLGTVPRRWRCHRLRAALVTGCAEIALSFNRSFRARLFSRSNNPFCHLSLSPLVTIPPKNWHLHTHDISSSDLVPMGS